MSESRGIFIAEQKVGGVGCCPIRKALVADLCDNPGSCALLLDGSAWRFRRMICALDAVWAGRLR